MFFIISKILEKYIIDSYYVNLKYLSDKHFIQTDNFFKIYIYILFFSFQNIVCDCFIFNVLDFILVLLCI